MDYTKEQLVQLAKRHNNNKRPYLLVNPLQGKHIPVEPHKCFSLFQELSQRLYASYPNEKLFIIGFAETATAIGAAIAVNSPLDTYYIHTTRETLEQADYLYFTESHSHATEQKLVCNHLKDFITKTDRIIFVEDEVTTGNTILNIINLLNKQFSNFPLKYGIASILNSMEPSVMDNFKQLGISFDYLLHLDKEDYTEKLNIFSYPPSLVTDCRDFQDISYSNLILPSKSDPRIGVSCKKYQEHCDRLASHLFQELDMEDLKGKKVLVLGTEEFMFPPLYFAAKLEQSGLCSSVHFHATTRSPISADHDRNYPIHNRYILNSYYDDDRITYIYNLDPYDYVIILSDTSSNSEKAMAALSHALKLNHCNNIQNVKWIES